MRCAASPAPYRLDTQRPHSAGCAASRADVGAVVPAALALGVRAGAAPIDRLVGGRGDRREHRARGDQHEAQVVAERLQQRQRTRRSRVISTSACSDEPILPATRSVLELASAPRRARRGCAAQRAQQFAAALPGRRKLVPGVGNTLTSRPACRAASAQISSAVNDRIGAISRTRRLQDLVQRGLRRAPRARIRAGACTAGP